MFFYQGFGGLNLDDRNISVPQLPPTSQSDVGWKMSSHWVLVVSTYDDHRTSPKCLVCSVFSFLFPHKTHKQTNISHHGKKVALFPIFPPGSLSPLRFPPKNHFKTPPTQKKESCPWRFTGNDTGSPGDFHLPGAIFFVEVSFFLSQFFFGSDFGSVWHEGFLTVCFFVRFFLGGGFMSRWIDSKNCPERDSNPTAPTIEVSECRIKKNG